MTKQIYSTLLMHIFNVGHYIFYAFNKILNVWFVFICYPLLD